MKKDKNVLIAFIIFAFFIIGAIMAYFCTEGWQKILGLIILIIDIICGIDLMSDSL